MSPLVSRLFRAAIFAGVLVGFPSPMLAQTSREASRRGGRRGNDGRRARGGRVFRFLDNGILRARISANGGVYSIKYLPPGAKGTPAAQARKLVSQSGEGFRGHTAIYYYWYPTRTAPANLRRAAARGFPRSCVPAHLRAGVDKVAMDIEIHYVLGRGDRGLYVYLVARHPAGYRKRASASSR